MNSKLEYKYVNHFEMMSAIEKPVFMPKLPPKLLLQTLFHVLVLDKFVTRKKVVY